MEAPQTESLIPRSLAKELSLPQGQVEAVLALLAQGYVPPYIARVRRADVGDLSEGQLRRIARRAEELEVIELRRANILRSLRAKDDTDPKLIEAVEACMDRFELEDLFIAHRRPEIEVQRALDHGLQGLADKLVERQPKTKAPKDAPSEGEPQAEATAEPAAEAPTDEAPAATAAPAAEAPAATDAPAEAPAASEAPAAEAPPVSTVAEPTTVAPADASPSAESPTAQVPADQAPAVEPASADAAKASPAAAPAVATAEAPSPLVPDAIPSLHHGLEVTPELARACAAFVNTDRGVHNEEEALDGAMRLLSDRLGRNARLRNQVRKLLRKEGRMVARPTGSGDPKRAGRYKAFFKLDTPLRQLQPHTLIALRQAQKERILTTDIKHSGQPMLDRVRGALGRNTLPEFESVLDAVARRALERRLIPMIEPDIRLELKERGDAGALRFLAKYLRRQLLALPGGDRPVLGVKVNARGAWVIVRLDERGAVLPTGANEAGEPTLEVTIETKAEAGPRPAAELAAELQPLLEDGRFRSVAIGAGKSSRTAIPMLREALVLAGSDAFVFVINDAGLGSWANSAGARDEHTALSVPAREAAGLGRRFQDPLLEMLKAEPRHLVHGMEQSHVSKAALARVLEETIKSCVAFVGCNVNKAPEHMLSVVPGLTKESIDKLIARRVAKPFANREELREVLGPVEWQNAVAFLQVHGGDTPLDATGLHPEQYPLVTAVLEASGRSMDEVFGKLGGLKGVKRSQLDKALGIDDAVWRDLTRELAHPGRDPRPRIYVPRLFTPDVDPATLEKGQVVEGIVTNVANFGAFVDIGLVKDAMVHVSDATSRYVSDAREVFAVGDIVRAKVIAANGPRITLTLKGVGKDRPRHGAPVRGERAERGGRGERGDRGARTRAPKPAFDPGQRAAQVRRDGLTGGPTSHGRGGARKGGRFDRDKRGGERFDRRDLANINDEVKFNPFAQFFKDDGEEEK